MQIIAGSSITNSASVNVGDNGVGIYNLNGNVTNSGAITAGNGGTGIYSEGGNDNFKCRLINNNRSE